MSNKVESFDSFSDMQSTFITNYMEMDDPTQEVAQHANWCKRTFGPMKRGGMRMSIISLLAPLMGVGMLGLPFRAQESGIVSELIMIALAAAISCLSMHILSWASSDLQCSSFSELVQMSLGAIARKIFEVVTITYCLLGCTQLQISFQLLMFDVCKYFGQGHYDPRTVAIYTQMAFVLPNLMISWQKSLYSLRYFTTLGVCSMMYLALMIVLDFIIYGPTWNEIATEADFIKVDMNIFTTFAMTFFCFICHLFIFPIKKELQNPTINRQSTIWIRVTLVAYIIYSLISFSGYLNFLDQTQLLIIQNYHGNIFFVGKIGMACAMFFAVPLNILACRNIVNDMLISDEIEYKLKHRNMKVSAEDGKIVFEVESVDNYKNKIHCYTTLALQLGSAMLALLLPEITRFITLMGGLLGTTMVCIFPTLIYIKEYSGRYSITIIILECMAIVFGWIGAIYSQF